MGILSPKEEIDFKSQGTASHLNRLQLEILEKEISVCSGIIFQGGCHYDDFF